MVPPLRCRLRKVYGHNSGVVNDILAKWLEKRKASGSFSEEKEPKRLFLIWAKALKVPAAHSAAGIAPEGSGARNSRLQRSKSFLRRFFSKKRPLPP
jgi:hypothetical protein